MVNIIVSVPVTFAYCIDKNFHQEKFHQQRNPQFFFLMIYHLGKTISAKKYYKKITGFGEIFFLTKYMYCISSKSCHPRNVTAYFSQLIPIKVGNYCTVDQVVP